MEAVSVGDPCREAMLVNEVAPLSNKAHGRVLAGVASARRTSPRPGRGMGGDSGTQAAMRHHSCRVVALDSAQAAGSILARQLFHPTRAQSGAGRPS